MMNVHVLVDSLEYARTNCYVHQLLLTLERECSIKIFTLAEIMAGYMTNETPDRTLSLLKLRTLDRHLLSVKKCLGDQSLFVYEQDVWESFKDDSPYKGAYHRITNVLNVTSFLNTSKWWSDFVASRGLPSRFVTMWMLPEYCTTVPRWDTRKIDVGFCGRLHPHRQEFFEGLRGHGITVEIVPTTSYANYLTVLSQTKVFVHSESVDWTVDGEKFAANALWIKDVEAASRGCISVRDFEPEANNYGAEKIQSILTFEKGNVAQAADAVKQSLTRANVELIHSSVEFIRSAPGWRTVIQAMEKQ